MSVCAGGSRLLTASAHTSHTIPVCPRMDGFWSTETIWKRMMAIKHLQFCQNFDHPFLCNRKNKQGRKSLFIFVNLLVGELAQEISCGWGFAQEHQRWQWWVTDILLYSYPVFYPVLELKPVKRLGAASPPANRVGVSYCRASEGSEAAGSCDHCGASTASSLMELGELQGDVYQGGQHHLHTTQTSSTLAFAFPDSRALLKSTEACQQSDKRGRNLQLCPQRRRDTNSHSLWFCRNS